MAARITRASGAPRYHPPKHENVTAFRLQGHEAGPTERFWIGLSVYEPGGQATEAPAGQETVYVVLDGELTVRADGADVVLGQHDSVHLSRGTVRSVHNHSSAPATLLVAIATPLENDGS